MKQLTIRSISLLLALVLITGMIPTAHAAYTLDPWAMEEVGEMSDMGLVPDSLLNADLTKTSPVWICAGSRLCPTNI